MNAFRGSSANRVQRALTDCRAQGALVLITSAAAVLVYLPLRTRVGLAAGLIAFVPLILCGLFFGSRGGLLAGLATPVLNTLLLNLAGHPGWDVVLRETAGLGPLAIIAVGVIVGRWSDLARALRQQVAENRHTQQALQESVERFRGLVEASTEGIAILQGAEILDANPALAAMYGYDLAEMLGQNAAAFAAPATRDRVAHNILSGQETPYEAVGLRKDGTTFPAEITGRAIRYEGRTARVAIIHNLTERRRAEATLRESEQRSRALWEAAQRQSQELTLLDRVRQALARELELSLVIRAVVEGIAQTFGYALVSLYLLDGDQLKLQHQVGYAQVIEQVPVSQGISGRVVRTGKPVLLEDVHTDPAFLGAIEGLTSEVCVPLFDQGQVMGVLNVESTQGVKLTEADLRLMLALSEQVGLALGRARLYADMRASEQRFENAIQYAAIGMALVAPDGRWLKVNQALCELVGYTEAELLATTFQAITHPDDLETDLEHVRQLLAGEIETYQMEKRYFHQDGHVVWALLSVSLVRDPHNQPLYFISQIQDVTERKQAETALRESQEQYRRIVEQASDIIYRMDANGHFTFVNPAALRVMKCTETDLVGKHFLDLIRPDYREATLRFYQSQFAQRLSNTYFELPAIARDGTEVWIGQNVQFIEEDRTAIMQAVARDITERKQVEVAVRESEARYRGLFEDSPISLWEEDFSAVKALLDELRQQGVTDFRAYLTEHPEVVSECVARVRITDVNAAALKLYRASSKADLLAKFERVFTPGSYDSFVDELVNIAEGRLAFERQSLNQSLAGERLQLILHWAVARGHEDSLSKVIVSLLDITEREQAKQALERANERLEQGLLEAEQRTRYLALLHELGSLLQDCRTAGDAYTTIGQVMPVLFPFMAGRLLILDAAGAWATPVAHWGDGAAGEAFAPGDCWALQHRQLHLAFKEGVVHDRGVDPTPMCPHVAGQPPDVSVCIPLAVQEQTLGLLHLFGSRVQGPRAAAVAFWTEAQQHFARTVADSIALSLTNLNLHESLRQQAIRDPLTGLFNRRYLEETLGREVSRVTRSLRPLGVIMLDLDHFKHFNDTYGHMAGDTLLEALGAKLRTCVRGEDIACRYGGEEFLLILPEAPLAVTQARANHLREAVKQLMIYHEGQPLETITVSAGVAEYPEHGRTREAVLRAADQALYQAKREGRDRVVVADPMPLGT